MAEWEFPEPQALPRDLTGMSVDEALFYQVRDEVALDLLATVPGCVGIALDWLPTKPVQASGPVRFGGFTISVGSEAAHLMYVKSASMLPLQSWASDNFGILFAGGAPDYLSFDFQTAHASRAHKFVVGFASRSDAHAFATKYIKHFMRPIANFNG
ncbi:MAG TPA: hypothetical protein VMM60_08800 [Ilumatobacter sp.]|nr:hypothetical protein [Ilumatobacter sp.]